MSSSVLDLVVAGGALVVQVIALSFVFRVSTDYQKTVKGVDTLEAEVKAIALRERRAKLLAECLYHLASLQARFSQRGMTLLFSLATSKEAGAHVDRVKASLGELADQIEIASHEVGMFSDSQEVRRKALRSLVFGRSGPNTLSLLDHLIELDVENSEDYKQYRRALVSGLWVGWHNATDWTG